VKVKMDGKTVAADYIISEGMAYVSAWTLLKVPSEFNIKVGKVEFNPAGILVAAIFQEAKDYILENT